MKYFKIFVFVFCFLGCLTVHAQNAAQLQREMESAVNEAWNKMSRNTVRPASFKPKAWKITMQGHLVNNNDLLFVSKSDCERAINTLINDMVNITVRMASKYSYTPSQSERADLKNNARNMLNCGCREVNNPNYKPETAKPMVDYGNPYAPNTNQLGDNNQLAGHNMDTNRSSMMEGSIFSVPSAREQFRETIAQSSESPPPEINMANLDLFINSQNTENNLKKVEKPTENITTAIVIEGPKLNTQSDEKLTPLTAGGTHGNIFLKGQKTEDLDIQLEAEEYVKWKSEVARNELQRQEDVTRYEKLTPWYDKKIDKFNAEEESRSISDYAIVGSIYAAKGVGAALDKSGEFLEGVAKGQAKKELKEGAIILLDGFTKGKVGKDEVNAIKGYGETMTNHHFLFQKDGAKKLVEAIDNPTAYYQEQKKLEEGTKKTADDYSQAKGFITPQKIADKINEPKNFVIKKANEQISNKLPDRVNKLKDNYDKSNGSWLKWLYDIQVGKGEEKKDEK